MLAGIILLVLAGMGWVGVGTVVSSCAAHKINLSLVQLGQTIICILVGVVIMSLQPAEPCPFHVRLLAFVALFLSGIGNFSAYELMNRAMQRGPNGIIWALVQSALVLPFIFGVVFFGAELTAARLCGLVLILLSILFFGLAQGSPAKKSSRATGKKNWLGVAMAAFTVGGLTQICASVPSYLKGAEALGSVTRTVYLMLGALAGFFIIWSLHREKMPTKGTLRPMLVLSLIYLLILFGVMFRGLNMVAAAGAGSIGYPVMIGSCIVGFSLYSRIHLKEKATWKSTIGLIACILGIVTISI